MSFKWIIFSSVVVVAAALVWFELTSFTSSNSPVNVKDYEQAEPIEKFDQEYDVIVVGGEPEGVAAAVSSARNGAKTLLIEDNRDLGGLMTIGMLNFIDAPQGKNNEVVSKGIYEEWHQLVGGGNAFGINEAKAAFQQLVEKEDKLTLSVETKIIDIIKDNDQITSIVMENPEGTHKVFAKRFIDATQDADFAALAGVPYFTGGEDLGLEDRKMAVTLMIHLQDVNWDGVKKAAETEKFGKATVTDTVAWGFSQLHYDYKPIEENTRLRGLNLVKIDNDYYINALQIFGVDGLDAEAKMKAIEKGKRETQNILNYLKEEFPGFENAKVASYPDELYVRETRHVVAEYQLPMSDVWTNKDHWDSIGMGAYPVDVQAQTPQDYGYVIANPTQYAIPFRSLVPKTVEGLLVTGRSAGFSSLAAGSARIVPTGMVTGEASGAAAALSLEENVLFRELSKDKTLIEKLRERLREQGAYVEHYTIDYPYQGEYYDEAVQQLMNYGIIVAGYKNDIQAESEVKLISFINILKNALHRAQIADAEQLKVKLSETAETFSNSEEPVTRNQAAAILTSILEREKKPENDWTELIDLKIADEVMQKEIQKNRPLKRKEVYYLVANTIDFFTK